MGLGNDAINNIERLLIKKVIKEQNLFRFSRSSHFSFSSKFEREVSGMYKNYNCLLLPSASIGLWLFIRYLNLSKNSEVITSPLGWVANYSALRLENLKIIFSPLDENLNIIPEEIEKLITKRTKIILVVHLMGRKQKYIKEIKKLAKKNKLILIEDIAQSFGIGLNEDKAGIYGDFAYCSLNHHKILSTGDGGFIITKDNKIFKGIQSLHDQGCLIKNGKRHLPVFPSEGLSLRVNELTAAAAYSQIVKFNYIKMRIWKTYNEISKIMKEFKNTKELKPSQGDIPFFYLFNKVDSRMKNHPSLLASGWHFVGNIPYFKDTYVGMFLPPPSILIH